MKKTISQVVSERILILDGAMGTMIQQYNLKEEDFRGERFAHIPGQLKGNNDLLCLTRPDVIQDIHRKYLEAGADIIETNTFSSTTVSMADYHVEEYVREMNLAAVKLARDLADEYTAKNPDKPRFVAGSVGPTNKTCSMSPDVNNPAYRALSYDELAASYQQQMEAMLEGGVDAILIETIFDTLNAKAATEKQKRKLKALQKETKTAKTLALTVQDIEAMGKKATFGNNITLTPDECRTLKDYAVSSFAEKAEKIKYKQKFEQAEKSAKTWKQRYDALHEQYQELKKKAQPFLDALEIASERVRAFLDVVLSRGKETQEHKAPARKRGQDMEL